MLYIYIYIYIYVLLKSCLLGTYTIYSARPEGAQRPEGERFISYTYRIRHDLCNLCHRGMPSEVLHLCKQLLQEVRKLIFCSNLRSV